LNFPASGFLGVESTIFDLKLMGGREFLSRRFKAVEVVVIGYPLDARRILEKFSKSGIQNFLFIMFQINKIKFQNLK